MEKNALPTTCNKNILTTDLTPLIRLLYIVTKSA